MDRIRLARPKTAAQVAWLVRIVASENMPEAFRHVAALRVAEWHGIRE